MNPKVHLVNVLVHFLTFPAFTLAICNPSVDCKVNGVDHCVVVEGEMHIFTGDASSMTRLSSSYTESVVALLKKKADSDDFNEAHPAVEKVSFIELDLSTLAPTTDGLDADGGSEGNSDIGLPVALTVAGAVVMLAAAIAIRMRKQKDSDNELESTTGDATVPSSGAVSA